MMAQSSGPQLETVLDKVLKSGDVQALDAFLENVTDQGTPMRCSQQFLSKLDKLISGSLDQKDAKAASLGFATLHKCGEYLKLPGADEGLSSLISKGLIKKWFEKCKQLWIQCGPHWDETLLTLSENFLNALMVVLETCKEGPCRVTESFLYPVGQLAVDPRIYILIQKEAIHKYNLILDKIPVEIKKKKKILTSQEASDIMTKLAACILEGGDYDLQSSLMEALCRMATHDQRKKLVGQWFREEHLASALAQISDADFETGCRKFLNMVNEMQGDKRRVYSFPCLEAYLGKYELLMPSEEKLEEFWIDFNLGSHSISFYFSLPDKKDGYWETICINENEVQSFIVTEKGKRQVLQIELSVVVVVGEVEGSNLTVHFNSSLDILKAACNIYGHSKNKLTNVGTTAGKTANEVNNTQVVPESQVSNDESEKNTGPYILSATPASVDMVTPARRKISESTTFIRSSGGESVLHGNCLTSKQSSKDDCKPSQGKFSSRDKTVQTSSLPTKPGSTHVVGMKRQYVLQKKSVAETIHMTAPGQREEKSLDPNFCPDSQPRTRRSTSLSGCKLSVSDILMMPTQKVSSLPSSEHQSTGQQEPCQSSTQKLSIPCKNIVLTKQIDKEPTQHLQQVPTKKNQDPPPQEPTPLQRKKNRDAESGGSMVVSKETNTRSTDKAPVTVQNWPRPPFTRSIFNTSWKPAEKRENSSVMKFHNKTTAKPIKQREDVFAFNIGSPGKIGEEKKPLTKISKRLSNGIKKSAVLPDLTKKEQPKTKEQYVKKHLFSDTDTDTTMTEISWLRESAKKPKPKITQYPGLPHVKPKVAPPLSPHESQDLIKLAPKVVNNNDEPRKEKSSVKTALDPPNKALNPSKTVRLAAASSRPHATGHRPKRTAATFIKSYRESDTDDDHCEKERTTAPKRSFTDDLENTENAYGTAQSKKRGPGSKQPETMETVSEMKANSKFKQLRAGKNILKETSKLNKKIVPPAQEQTSPLKDCRGYRQTPLCQSPPFIEKMRSYGAAPVVNWTSYPVLSPQRSLLPTSPEPLCKDTSSPIPLLPKLCSTVSMKRKCKPSSLYSTEKNNSATNTKPPLSSCSVGYQSPALSPLTQPTTKQHLSSVAKSPFSTQPLLTSTLCEPHKPCVTSSPQPTFPEDTLNHSCPLDFSKVTSGSLVSLSQSSLKSAVHSSDVQDSTTAALMGSLKSEKTPPKDEELEFTQHLISGVNLRRHMSLSSNSEENEMEKRKESKTREQHPPQMKPRKLFKSFAEPVEEFNQLGCSSLDLSSSHWEPGMVDEHVDIDEGFDFPEIHLNPSDFCPLLSSEIKKKSQVKVSKMLENYNKQSSNTVEQHFSSIGMQLTKHRTQKLEQIQKVLLDEIHVMEQDDNNLRNMEKDLTANWKKQIMAFHSYQQQETSRNETLGKIFQTQACDSPGYEGIFTSKIGQAKSDMKSDQHRFINDMMAEEMQSLKRGLQTLFSS